MERVRINQFNAGINEAQEPDRIPDNSVQSAIDLEYNNSEVLSKRESTENYSILSDTLVGLGIICSQLYVWYAPVMPEDATDDKVFLVYTGSELWLIYGGTRAQRIEIEGISYSGEITFVNGNDKIIIVDEVNKTHFIKFDKFGDLVTGIYEYPSPKNKIVIEPITGLDDYLFEDILTEDYLGDCGEYQYIYCYADRFGNLSNPSPVSETYYIDYFKIDADSDDEQKVDRIFLTNMALPDGLDNAIKDNVEEFYIFRRNVRFTQDQNVGAFDLVKVIPISSKSPEEIDEDNEYTNSWTDVDLNTQGQQPSYGNLAPIAKDAISTAGVTFLAGAKTKDVFLWDFKYKCPIKISNNNTTNYFGCSIILEIDKSYIKDKDGNEIFDPNDYQTPSGVLFYTNNVVLFDTDQTTPLNTVVYYFDGDKIRMFVKIPQLTAGEHVIYLCWTPEADFDNYDGVPLKYYKYEYGKWFDATNFAFVGNQKTLVDSKVLNDKCILCSDFEFLDDGEVVNKANINHNGEITNCELVDGISRVPFLEANISNFDFNIGNSAVKLSADESNVDFGNLGITKVPNKGSIFLRIGFNLSTLPIVPSFFSFYDSSTGETKLSLNSESLTNQLYISNNGSDYTFSNSFVRSTSGDRFICVSWDLENGKLSIYNSSISSGFLASQEISIDDETDLDFTNFYIGKAPDTINYPNTYVDDIILLNDVYLKADILTDYNSVFNHMNYLAQFEQSPIGYVFDGNFVNGIPASASYNVNILFDEAEEIKYYDDNRVMWTEVNGLSFNLSSYKDIEEPCKRIIQAPYFLQDTYGNSAIIFTRNQIIRFLLSGSPNEWALQTDNIIKEYTQYGLLSDNSLGRYGESLFWHSEVGFIKWDRSGINIISRGRLDIPVKDTIIGFPVPLRNQYIFHDNSENKSWVYHIDYDSWTIFNGLDIADVQILSGGDSTDNYNLFVKSDGYINYYPTGTLIRNAEITTKKYPFDNLDFYRFRMDYEGSQVDVTTTVKNIDGDILQEFQTNRMEWNYLENGSWGENIQFEISGAIKLKKIEFDINRR